MYQPTAEETAALETAKARLTPEFLETLRFVVWTLRPVTWEIAGVTDEDINFVIFLYQLAELPEPTFY